MVQLWKFYLFSPNEHSLWYISAINAGSTKKPMKMRLFLDWKIRIFFAHAFWTYKVWPIWCVNQNLFKLCKTMPSNCVCSALCDSCKSETTTFFSLLLMLSVRVLLMKWLHKLMWLSGMFPVAFPADHISHIKLVNKCWKYSQRWRFTSQITIISIWSVSLS